MPNYERRVKILSSLPLQFLGSAVGFGFLSEGTSNNSFSWWDVVIHGGIFGFIVVVLIRMGMRIAPKTNVAEDRKPQWQVEDAIRAGVLPEDPKLLKALPAYLDKREENAEKNRKQVLPVMLILAMAILLLGVLNHKILIPGIFAVLGLTAGVTNYFVLKNMGKKIDILRKQL